VRGLLVVAVAAFLPACSEPPCPSRAGFVCPIAGTGELAFNADGLPANETHLFLPSAARRGPDDRVYVMDFNNYRLRIVDDDDRVQTVIGTGEHAIAALDVPATDSPTENPIDFAFLSDGRLVFVSYHDPRVLVLELDGTLGKIAGADDGVVGILGNEGDGGPPEDAMFIQLDSIAIAPDDTIYVSDSLANRVRRIRAGIIETVAGTGDSASTGDDGPGVDAAVNWPSALALDAQGNLFVAETHSHVVRKLDPGGTITLVAGTREPGDDGDGGEATAARLKQPYGLAVDDDGTLYIADRGNFRIRSVSPQGIIETIAGTGRAGLAGDDGPATSARFDALARLALDDDGLLVADQGNSVIRRVNLR
jgi:sugar lactone lactonase YvrE